MRRALLVLVVAVVAVNVVVRELDHALATPGGPASSSFATAPEGLAAYADLLRRYDHPVTRLRDRLAEASLDPASTLVVLEPRGLSREDGSAARMFVERGGRLVAGGEPRTWLASIVGTPPRWAAERVPVSSPAPDAKLGDLARVSALGPGAWKRSDRWQPTLAGPSGGLLAVEGRLGSGEAFLLADPSPLQNRALARADNAALGVALAGEPGRGVVFAESVHGYGRASGLAAVPDRWLWVLGGLCAAALVLALARGRRFGPPEHAARELPPARVEYVEALAALLAKARPRDEALQPLRDAVRAQLGRDPWTAGARLGLAEDEVGAVLGTGAGDHDVVAVGRALARLEHGRRRREETMT